MIISKYQSKYLYALRVRFSRIELSDNIMYNYIIYFLLIQANKQLRYMIQVHLNELECREKVEKSETFIYFRFITCKVKHFKSFFSFNFDD